MKNAAITIAVALVAVSTLSAQSSKKGKSSDPTPLDVTVSQIHDRRTNSFFSSLNITLELAGITASDVTAARVTVSKAVDDTGRDLVDREKSESTFDNTRAYLSGAEMKTPASIDLALKNPAREAVMVKEVRGEVELYMPGKDKDAVAVIPKFQSLAGKPIANKALKASGVEIGVIGKAQLEAEKKKASKAKAEELKKEGADDESIKYTVSSFEEYFLEPEAAETVLKVKDPNGRIHEFAFVDSTGATQRVFDREQDGFKILSTFGAAPGADWSLRVTLRTPKTMARHTFALNDVELP